MGGRRIGVVIQRRESAPRPALKVSSLKQDLWSISLGLEKPDRLRSYSAAFLDAEVLVKPKSKGGTVLVLRDDAHVQAIAMPRRGSVLVQRQHRRSCERD